MYGYWLWVMGQRSVTHDQLTHCSLSDVHVHKAIYTYVVCFSAETETHSVPAVIPRHYPATFLNCNTHSGPSSGIATLKIY